MLTHKATIGILQCYVLINIYGVLLANRRGKIGNNPLQGAR